MQTEDFYPRFERPGVASEHDVPLEGATLVLPAIASGIGRERHRRATLLLRTHEVVNYLPDGEPREPVYADDPDRYIAAARGALNNATLTSDMVRHNTPSGAVASGDPESEDRMLHLLYIQWRDKHFRADVHPLWQNNARRFDMRDYYAGVLPYLLSTVKALTASQGAIAQEAYVEQRRQIVQHLPASREEAKLAIDTGELRITALSQAERTLRSLPYSLATANFFNLYRDQQQQIFDKIGDEFLVFAKYAFMYGDGDDLKGQSVPVFRRPVSELEEVMRVTQDPEVAFLVYSRNDPSFEELLQEARTIEPESTVQLSLGEQLVSMEAGDILQICGEGETIRIRELRSSIAESVKEVAEILSAVENPGSRALLADWDNEHKDIAFKLIAKSNGSISNVRIQAMQVDEEYMSSVTTNWSPEKVPLETVRRFAIIANIRAGTKVVPTMLEFLVYVRRNPNGTGTVYKSARGRSTGAAVIEAELDRSRKSGLQQRTRAAQTPLSVGLPGLGRR